MALLDNISSTNLISFLIVRYTSTSSTKTTRENYFAT